MTAVLPIDAILAGGSGWCVYAMDAGKRPDGAVLARARRLHAEGVVSLSQRRERSGVAYVMRRREDAPAATAVPMLRTAAPRQDRTCAVPGCRNALWSSNTAGVCRAHTHHPTMCRCLNCERRRVPEPPRTRKRRWTDDQVVGMRAMWRGGATYPEIIKVYGGREGIVAKAVCGATYTDVPGGVTEAERRRRYGKRGRRG